MIIRIANHHYDHHHHQLVTGANSFQQLCELFARLTVCQKAVKFLPLQQWYSPSSLFSFPVTSSERFLLLLLLQLSTLLLTWHGHCVTLTNSSNTWHFNQTHTHTLTGLLPYDHQQWSVMWLCLEPGDNVNLKAVLSGVDFFLIISNSTSTFTDTGSINSLYLFPFISFLHLIGIQRTDQLCSVIWPVVADVAFILRRSLAKVTRRKQEKKKWEEE